MTLAILALASVALGAFACDGLVEGGSDGAADASVESSSDGSDDGLFIDVAPFDAGLTDAAISDSARCTAENCPDGCCVSGMCQTGTSDTACGFGGQTCVACSAQGLVCMSGDGGASGGVCAPPDAGRNCGPSNCNGCCHLDACVAGTGVGACGSHGQECAPCSGGSLVCTPRSGGGGQCVGAGACSPTSCTGCCMNGQCLDPASLGLCGSGGAACKECSLGEACNSGACELLPGCGPLNCPGCCQGDWCLAGIDIRACGRAGAPCSNCLSQQQQCVTNGAKSGGVCKTNGSKGCGPQDCRGPGAPGCCSFDSVCMPGNSNSYCANSDGTHDAGFFCGTCSGDCSSGICQGTFCGPGCSGCCMLDGTCWNGAKDSKHCGYDGELCFDCGPGYDCDQGFCRPTCGPTTCGGCCDAGVCVAGTATSACGTGGTACAACGPGQQCTSGQCVQPFICNTSTCAGCCTTTGFCALGIDDAHCGSGGHACTDCAGRGCDAGACGP